MIKKSIYFSVFIVFIVTIISCEKDFKDIASNVVSNTEFDTKDTIIEVTITNKQITSVRADGLAIGGVLGQYLLGVYNNPNYEKIEASVVSQLVYDSNVRVLDSKERVYGVDTTVVTTIDTVYLKIPYQATLNTGTTSDYTLESIIGDQTNAFNLNVYRTDTYMNRLNPIDPSKTNEFASDTIYQILPEKLNAQVDYQFIPNALDTAMIHKRRLSNGVVYQTDTVQLINNNPFARIPLDETKIEQLFIDQYETSSFDSQEAINIYFKGLYIEATGNEGSLMGFNIVASSLSLKPSIEIRYTKTVLKGGTEVVDTIIKSNSFLLSNFSTSVYAMTDKTYPNDKNIVIQGTAGSMAQVDILDTNQLNDLKSKNWLINDASLTFYVNQDIVGQDTLQTPSRLFLYKDGTIKAQLKDHLSEGATIFDGNLVVTDQKPDYYRFRITDYVSDLLSGKTTENPTLGLKVFNNPTDSYVSFIDTLVTDYSWNPKAVTLLNHFSSNEERRAKLKISYSVKK
jgi:hypothetical protein